MQATPFDPDPMEVAVATAEVAAEVAAAAAAAVVAAAAVAAAMVAAEVAVAVAAAEVAVAVTAAEVAAVEEARTLVALQEERVCHRSSSRFKEADNEPSKISCPCPSQGRACRFLTRPGEQQESCLSSTKTALQCHPPAAYIRFSHEPPQK
jgi:hypothetical protein